MHGVVSRLAMAVLRLMLTDPYTMESVSLRSFYDGSDNMVGLKVCLKPFTALP